MEDAVPRQYRASINLDYTNSASNEYQYLVSALIQAGWKYVETSSLVLDTEDLNAVWRGISLVMKQDSSISGLSSLTFHVQGSNDFANGLAYPYAHGHPGALASVEGKPYPV
jgi:hypothetical protein